MHKISLLTQSSDWTSELETFIHILCLEHPYILSICFEQDMNMADVALKANGVNINYIKALDNKVEMIKKLQINERESNVK